MDNTSRREADTMGFYVCVTLFAAMAAGDDQTPPQLRDLIALIWLTTVGLAFAHWLAATIAAQLVPEGLGHHPTIELLVAHVVLPAVIAAATTVVVLVMPENLRLLAGRLTAAICLAVLVGVEARRGERSPARAVRLAALAFACAAGIAVLKRLIF